MSNTDFGTRVRKSDDHVSHRTRRVKLLSNDLVHALAEATNGFSEKTSNVCSIPRISFFDFDARAGQNLTSSQQRPQFISGAGLDRDLFEPTSPNDLSVPSCVVAIGLVESNLQCGVCMSGPYRRPADSFREAHSTTRRPTGGSPSRREPGRAHVSSAT